MGHSIQNMDAIVEMGCCIHGVVIMYGRENRGEQEVEVG